MNPRPLVAIVAAALLLSGCATTSEGNPMAHGQEPLCSDPNETMVLVAQSVQGATRLPCVAGYPAGWTFLGKDVRRGSATYWLNSSTVRPGSRTIEVQLLPSCEPDGQPFTDERAVGADAYAAITSQGETRTYLFEGGCVIERIFLPEGSDAELMDQARSTLGFVSREALAADLEEEFDVVLCGAGADPCAG